MGKEPPNITKILGDHLAVLSSDIRITILNLLADANYPVEFSDIHKTLQPHFTDNLNTSYHLKKLQTSDFITSSETGYEITDLGSKILGQIKEMEKILTEDQTIMIRTSRYTLEPFNEVIIEQNLIREAQMTPEEALNIAIEAKRRLKNAHITYLTAPLIREFINAILIENSFEDYRHKLTRLGIPPYDIENQIISKKAINPREMAGSFGKNILEQYVLLNQLRQNYADLLLSGQFIVSDLERFSMSPIEFIISGSELCKILNSTYVENSNKFPLANQRDEGSKLNIFDLSFEIFCEIFKFMFTDIISFFSKGCVIINFEYFLEEFFKHFSNENLKFLLYYCIPPNSKSEDWPISLHLSLKANYSDYIPLLTIYFEEVQNLFVENENELFIKAEDGGHIRELNKFGLYSLPYLVIYCPKQIQKEFQRSNNFFQLKFHYQLVLKCLFHPRVKLDVFSKRSSSNEEHCFSNLQIPVEISDLNELNNIPNIIIDKISVNVLNLYLQEPQDNSTDKQFFNNLQNAIIQTFDYFEFKCSLLGKNLPYFQDWDKVSKKWLKSEILFQNWRGMGNYSAKCKLICGISLHGIPELIYCKTSLNLHEQTKNRDFAVQILDFVSNLLQKQNSSLPSTIQYVLSEPHAQDELLYPKNDILSGAFKKDLNDFEYVEIPNQYQINFLSPLKNYSQRLIIQIFQDLVKSKFADITVDINLKNLDFQKSKIEVEKVEMCCITVEEIFHLIQDLISINIGCIKLSL